MTDPTHKPVRMALAGFSYGEGQNHPGPGERRGGAGGRRDSITKWYLALPRKVGGTTSKLRRSNVVILDRADGEDHSMSNLDQRSQF
jgi:hypothetical protein